MRITPSTFFLSCFITLRGEKFLGDEGHTELNAKKSHRGKKTETGGSDPTFDGLQPPKVLWDRSRPSRRKRDRVLALPTPSFFVAAEWM